ncbi:POK18 protein, partial [Mionectes macconnelli]|nr:POK18 protein [Mionectes macconnelli]
WKYLGLIVNTSTVTPQKEELRTDIRTLHDVQKLVGDLQWIRSIVGITNEDLQPFLQLLHGTNPAQP